MKIIFFSLLFVSVVNAQATAYRADVFNLNNKTEKPDFTLEINEKKVGLNYLIEAAFKKNDELQMTESAIVNSETADIVEYKIDQKQAGESGTVTVTDKKIKISFKAENKPEKAVELNKPERLVAPANFDHWLQKNFPLIKEKKSLIFSFLVWDKMDMFTFKIKYLGEVDLSGKKTHHFKMNIDNAFISAFIDPIEIWYNLDMTEIQQYQGRVAVKLGQRPNLKDLDATVKYFH